MVIYLVTNLVNGKQYVGKTVWPLLHRWSQHRSDARNNYDTYLCRAIRKYGEQNFKIAPLVSDVEVESELNEFEVEYISVLGTKAPNGYNLTNGADGSTGYKHSEESREKIREARKHQLFTDEYRQRMSVIKKGIPHTEEHKAKIGAAHKGKTLSRETRNKISVARNGKNVSQETRNKISAAQTRTHCKNGHPRIASNLYGRTCRICANEQRRARYNRAA
jgi:group I intron endonuclease